jgi:hypothetical protein
MGTAQKLPVALHSAVDGAQGVHARQALYH